MERLSTIGCNIRTICFDYYGTLVQTRQGEPFTLIERWIKESGSINKIGMSFAKERVRLLYHVPVFYTGKQLLEKCYAEVCRKYQIEPKMQLFLEYVKSVFSDTVLFEGTKEVLENLRKRYAIGLVTNADNDILYQSIQKHGLQFDFVITSEAVRCNKPGKAIFQKAIACAKVSASELLMVGDSLTEDMLPAREMGMNCVWMNREHRVQGVSENLRQIFDIKELLENESGSDN